MTHAIDELPQTGVVSEQTDPSAANTFLSNQLIENNDGQVNQQDAGPAETAKTEEKVVTFVKKVRNEATKKKFCKLLMDGTTETILLLLNECNRSPFHIQ